MSPAVGASELMRSLGLLVDGPVVWGSPVRSVRAGVFVIELPTGLERAPIDHGQIRRWLDRVPDLRLDGERPTPNSLARRLAAFWLPSQPLLYVGRSARSLGRRLAAIYATPLGDARPTPAGQWLKTLSVGPSLRVWWAETDAHEEYEDGLLSEFATGVPSDDVAALPDPALVLPFANMEMPGGAAKPHGLQGALREPAQAAAAAAVAEQAAGRERTRVAERRSATLRKRAQTRAPAAQRPMPAPTYLSQDGLERVVAELDALRSNTRPQVIARVKAARELGDLRENADYEAARNEQSFLEGRIQTLETLVKSAVVVDATGSADAVALGSTVVVDVDGDEETYIVVGSTEADPSAGRISNASPVGKALLGRRAGDQVSAQLPSGPITCRIREVR